MQHSKIIYTDLSHINS